MRIGILGSGLMGGKLGTIFARAGHQVVFSYARQRKKLERLAHEAGGGARAGSPREAVLGADAVLLAVHWSRVDDCLAQAGDLTGKLVITCSLPMKGDDSELLLGHTSSGAEALARKIPQADVIHAFATVPSEALFGVFAHRGQGVAPSLVHCGGSAAGKAVAAELIRAVGFHPLDAGPLSMARNCEPFALLVAGLAYGGEGPELAYRFERVTA